MLYLLSAFILFIVFLSIQKDRRASIRYLLGTGLLYFAAVLFMLLYLSKDVRYYNIIRSYFLLSEGLWKNLMFVPLSRNTILRALNLFSLSAVFMGCHRLYKPLHQEQIEKASADPRYISAAGMDSLRSPDRKAHVSVLLSEPDECRGL